MLSRLVQRVPRACILSGAPAGLPLAGCFPRRVRLPASAAVLSGVATPERHARVLCAGYVYVLLSTLFFFFN